MKFNNEISIVISGSAGQGLQALEHLLLNIMKSSGYHVFAYSEFMSRIRGGNNSTEIRISTERVSSFVDRIDIFFPIDAEAMIRFNKRISDKTLIIGPEEYVDDSYKVKDKNVIFLDDSKTVKDADSKILINIYIFGIVSALMGIEKDVSKDFVRNYFKKSTEEQLKDNYKSIEKGYEFFQLKLLHQVSHPLFLPAKDKNNASVLYGGDAIGIGAIAGGCSFVSSYPMSPSTNVLVYMARQAENFGIVVEQAEDEICAINMALGAWYAGARAMVTTSGGGFALMTEGVSLAGAIESPIVIHLAQRPGPATGLPTKTEQGDLFMALYAGHGEFPRVIFAPGTKTEGVYISCRAFNIADKYQIPVFILTDQYYIDSANDVSDINISELKEEKYIVKTEDSYKRHALTKDGLSPRGIPGYGSGLVCADSDEHTEAGYITEDPEMRNLMVEKRLKKFDLIKEDVLPPKLTGSNNYKYLLVCWGSTFETVNEAVKIIGNKELALLHFCQVYPLHKDTLSLLKKAKKSIIIENNATSQFGQLLKLETGHQFNNAILKYDGMPFSVEEIIEKVKKLLKI